MRVGRYGIGTLDSVGQHWVLRSFAFVCFGALKTVLPNLFCPLSCFAVAVLMCNIKRSDLLLFSLRGRISRAAVFDSTPRSRPFEGRSLVYNASRSQSSNRSDLGDLCGSGGNTCTRGTRISLLSAALFSLSNIDAKTPVMHLALSLIVLGSASGVFVPANGAALLASVGPEQTGSAVGLLSTARNVGMAIGTASAATALLRYGAHRSGGQPSCHSHGILDSRCRDTFDALYPIR